MSYSQVVEIEEALQAVLSSNWSNVAVGIKLKPLLDLEKGDLCSACCLDLASKLRTKPADIAKVFLSQAPYQLSFEDGFLNYRFSRDKSFIERQNKASFAPEDYSIAVCLPAYHPSLEEGGYLRLCLVALLNHLLAGSVNIKSELYFADELIEEQSLSALYDLVLEKCQAAIANKHCTDLTVFIDSLDKRQDLNQVLFWSYPDYARHFGLRSFFVDKASHKTLALYLSRGLLSGYEEELLLDKLKHFPKEFIFNLLYYCATPLKSEDIDFCVPTMQEASNLLWFLDSTQERLGRHLKGLEEAEEVSLANLSTLENKLITRIKFLSLFYQRAALYGEVVEYTSALSDFLHSFAAYFNNPNFRRRLDEGACTALEKWILSESANAILNSNP